MPGLFLTILLQATGSIGHTANHRPGQRKGFGKVCDSPTKCSAVSFVQCWFFGFVFFFFYQNFIGKITFVL
jgi:hypothetical protein